jgi:regulatory protein
MKALKITDPSVALAKAEAFCAYQERSQQEVRNRLYEWGLWKDAVEDIIAKLILENYINEERFSKVFAGGKFRIKKWGRIKIRMALMQHNITEYCMKKAMQEIDERDYIKTLRTILKKKLTEIKMNDTLKKNYKAGQYAISRGYEPELVWQILNEK